MMIPKRTLLQRISSWVPCDTSHAGRVHKRNPAIDSMVLFIDEPVRLIEDKRFPKDVDDDRYSHLRQVILGESVGKVFNTSLVMTSLDVSVFGITDSGREIIPVVLASTLSVDHIVDKMWIPFFHNSSPLLDATERSMLKWLAASVSAAPRLVEIMGKALQVQFADTWSGSSQGLTLRQSMGAVLLAFNKRRESCYPIVPFPVGKYLHALINDEAITVDATILQYVRSSTFTNSITQFPNSRRNPVLVPESALCLLATATEVVSNDIIAKEIQKDLKVIWGNLLCHITSPESSPLGQPLEDVFPRVLRMRILSSHLKEGSSGYTTLQDLLAIKDMSMIKYTIGGAPYKAAKISNTGKSVTQDGVRKSLKQWEADTFEYVAQGVKSAAKRKTLEELLLRKIIAPTRIDITSVASSRNCFAWKDSIRSIDSELVLTIPLPNNDHGNLLMFFRMLASGSTSPPPNKVGPDEIVLVFEEKSKGENNESNEIWWGHFAQGKAGKNMKGPYDQHGKFCEAVMRITESDLEGDTEGFLRALKEGRFIYVYVTTHDGPTVYLTAKDLPDIKCNSLGVLILNREVTQRILGPIFNVYALTRSAM